MNYAEIDAVNWSTLKSILVSPLQYQHELATPRTDTAAMRFGRAAHAAVLEPEAFPLRYVARPDGLDRRTKEGKAQWAEFCELNAGREVLEGDEYARALAVRDAVRAHPAARVLLEVPGEAELATTWTDARTGIACKGRLDWVCEAGVVDLKTAATIEARAFYGQSTKRGYLGQLAWYRDGYAAATGRELPALLIAVESAAPHDVLVTEIDEHALSIGRAEYRRALDLLVACRASGQWPGRYPERQVYEVPAYLLTGDDEWTVSDKEVA